VLKLLQAEYLKKVLKRFNMADAKPVNVPLRGHFKLLEAISSSRRHTLTTEDEKALMSEVSYASAGGNLMYAIVARDYTLFKK